MSSFQPRMYEKSISNKKCFRETCCYHSLTTNWDTVLPRNAVFVLFFKTQSFDSFVSKNDEERKERRLNESVRKTRIIHLRLQLSSLRSSGRQQQQTGTHNDRINSPRWESFRKHAIFFFLPKSGCRFPGWAIPIDLWKIQCATFWSIILFECEYR